MGFAKRFTKLSADLFLGTIGLFIDKMKSKEAQSMLHELKILDERVEKKFIDIHHAKKEFKHSFHRLENTIKRLIKRGEKFEAQHLYHVYKRYAEAFDDKEIINKLKKIHP